MNVLTTRQKQRIRQIVQDRHLALIVSLCGADAVPPDVYERLDKAGMIKLPKTAIDFVTASHLLGAILSDVTPEVEQKLTPASFWNMSTRRTELTSAEADAVAVAKDSFAEQIRAAGSKVEHAVLASVAATHDEMRRRYLTVKDRKALAAGVASRMAVKDIGERMRVITKDGQRDWMRLAHTEVHNFVEEAKAVALLKTGHGDMLVYKQPRPDACPYCKLLYLRPDGTPRIFTLQDMMANGVNVGRKAGRPTLTGKHKTGWKATLGAVHPWCRCALRYLPDGHGFGPKGKIVPVAKAFIEIETIDRAYAHHECDHG